MAIAQIPFMKLVEDVMLEVRENSSETSVENKYKRRVNDIYVRDIPSKFEFDALKKETYFTLAAAYDTGTASVSSGSTDIRGTGTTWTTAMTGRKIKIAGNDEIYSFTYMNTSRGTLDMAMTGSSDINSASYIIYDDTYNLASDYDRVVDPPGFYYNYSGSKILLNQKFTRDWFSHYTTNKSNFPDGWRLLNLDYANQQWQIQIGPPVSDSRLIYYEYIPLFTEMTEYVSGTCSVTAGSTTIAGSSTNFTSSSIDVGDAFRFDTYPNDWYIISSTTSSTELTISAAYPYTVNGGAYTICKVPKMPVKLHQAIFFGACALSSQDQDNATAAKNYFALYTQVISEYNAEINRMKRGKQSITMNDMYRRK